jgi:hypothetical protein
MLPLSVPKDDIEHTMPVTVLIIAYCRPTAYRASRSYHHFSNPYIFAYHTSAEYSLQSLLKILLGFICYPLQAVNRAGSLCHFQIEPCQNDAKGFSLCPNLLFALFTMGS